MDKPEILNTTCTAKPPRWYWNGATRKAMPIRLSEHDHRVLMAAYASGLRYCMIALDMQPPHHCHLTGLSHASTHRGVARHRGGYVVSYPITLALAFKIRTDNDDDEQAPEKK